LSSEASLGRVLWSSGAIEMNRKLILNRFSDTPLAVAARVLPQLYEAGMRQLMQRDDDDDVDNSDISGSGLYRVGNIGIVRVSGILVNGPVDWFDETSYQDIADDFDDAMDDDDIAAVVLQVDSPGGEVGGLFDLVDLIHANRGRKPIVGLVDDTCLSAAYAIASAAGPAKVYKPLRQF
jgi:ClpP class serine protease